MHAHDEHFLVVGTVEDADAPALGKDAGRPPEKIVLQFLGAGMLEAVDLAALRIDAGHDVLDGAVFAGGVHGLKNQQQRIAVVGVQQVLQIAQVFDVPGEHLFVLFLRADRRASRRSGQLVRSTLLALANFKSAGIEFVFHRRLPDGLARFQEPGAGMLCEADVWIIVHRGRAPTAESGSLAVRLAAFGASVRLPIPAR